MKIAIVGSRAYSDLDKVRQFVRSLPENSIVVSGGARGVDETAADEARKCGLAVIEFLPEWEKYGRSAGFRRNVTIVKNSDIVAAFWDGHSKGTAHTIFEAKESGKPVHLCPPFFHAI